MDTALSSTLVTLTQYSAKYPSAFSANTREAHPKTIPPKNKFSTSPDSSVSQRNLCLPLWNRNMLPNLASARRAKWYDAFEL